MLEDRIASYLDMLSKAAIKAGPQVMQFAVQNEKWCGVQDIMTGLFLALIGVGLVIWARKGWDYLWDNGNNPLGLIVYLIALGFGIAALIQLLNIWNWVAIFNPKIALFHDILAGLLYHG